jgi:manganese/iron transport system permease protein
MVDVIFLKTVTAAALAGAGCGLIGVFIYLMNIPFIGVAIAHSAMAGGIWGVIFGLPAKASAYFAAFFSSAIIGPVADRSKAGANITLSIIFSFVMGLAFMGVGLVEGKNRLVMNYLWGNILLADFSDIAMMSAILAVSAAVIIVFYRQYSAMLFNREIAASLGINDRLLYYLLLALIGAIVTVSLETIGGLMLFSIIITPPAIAYQFTFDLKKFFALSSSIGAAGSSAGVAIAFAFNLPVSATVVIFMTLLFFGASAISPKRIRYGS